jgi:hypothetical protein
MNDNENITVKVTDFLVEIDKADAIQIWVPSKAKYYSFKQLTFEQYNQFLALETQDLDVVTANYKFYEVLNKVIADNILETINTSLDFTVIDRDAIAIQLRFNVDDRFSYIIDENTTDISLKEHCSLITTIGNTLFPASSCVSHGSFSLLLGIPNINQDQLINTEILEYDQDTEKFPTFLLFAEVIKFIKAVNFVKGTETFSLPLFEPGKIAESIQICQKLPAALLIQVANYIEAVQTAAKNITTVEITVPEIPIDAEGKGRPQFVQKIPIAINANWFTSI